jgi:hypothetical protein
MVVAVRRGGLHVDYDTPTTTTPNFVQKVVAGRSGGMPRRRVGATGER